MTPSTLQLSPLISLVMGSSLDSRLLRALTRHLCNDTRTTRAGKARIPVSAQTECD